MWWWTGPQLHYMALQLDIPWEGWGGVGTGFCAAGGERQSARVGFGTAEGGTGPGRALQRGVPGGQARRGAARGVGLARGRCGVVAKAAMGAEGGVQPPVSHRARRPK